MQKNQSHAVKSRQKIQTTMLLKRLTDHALGKIDLDPSQVQSIKILLGKSLPDLKQSENYNFNTEIPEKPVKEMKEEELESVVNASNIIQISS